LPLFTLGLILIVMPLNAPAASGNIAESNLLNEYAPVLYFHPEEKVYPWGINSMLQNADLKKLTNKRKSPMPVDPTQLLSDNSDDLYLDLEICELRDGDTFVLCSDGLTREVPEEVIAKALATSTEGTLSENLINLALEQGAHDNTTVITVHVQGAAEDEEADAAPEATRTGNAAE